MKIQEKLLDIIKIKKSNSYYKLNNQLFDKIIDILVNSKSTYGAKNKITQDIQLLSQINEALPQLNNNTLYTKLHWILFDRHKFPTCQYCQQKFNNIDISVFGTYSKWCCRQHMNKDPIFKKIKADRLEQKYGKGFRCSLQIPSSRKKTKETWLKKYGCENPMQNERIKQKTKQTFIKKYGVDNNMKSEKGLQEYKNAMQKKYGVDYTWQLSSVIEKSQQTSYERYGVYITSQSQQAKDKQAETNLKKYGYKSALQNEQCHEKSIQASMKKYGTAWPIQCKQVQDKARIKYMYDNQNFDSSWELAFWIYCKDNNLDIKHDVKPIEYVDKNNVMHKYFPDFELNGQLIEIKGDDQFDENGKMINKSNHAKDYIAEAKYQCMLKNNVKILKGNDIKKYLDYIGQKYGKEYLRSFKKKINKDQ